MLTDIFLTKSLIAKAMVIVIAALAISPCMAADGTASNEVRKPLVLFVFDPACTSWNKAITPALKELKDEYSNRVTFDELDVSKPKLLQAKERAKALGVPVLLPDLIDLAPLVLVCSSSRKNVPGVNWTKRESRLQGNDRESTDIQRSSSFK